LWKRFSRYSVRRGAARRREQARARARDTRGPSASLPTLVSAAPTTLSAFRHHCSGWHLRSNQRDPASVVSSLLRSPDLPQGSASCAPAAPACLLARPNDDTLLAHARGAEEALADARGAAGGASERTAGAHPSASITAAGASATARISVRGAAARTAGAPPSAPTVELEAHARTEAAQARARVPR